MTGRLQGIRAITDVNTGAITDYGVTVAAALAEPESREEEAGRAKGEWATLSEVCCIWGRSVWKAKGVKSDWDPSPPPSFIRPPPSPPPNGSVAWVCGRGGVGCK